MRHPDQHPEESFTRQFGRKRRAPGALTSLTIVDPSPTNHSPLALSWGVAVGTADQYCLLENDSDSAHCVWHSGALPATYVDTASDGSFQMTAFLKNDYGVSPPVTSNSIALDRTAPAIASASVGNSNPTNNPIFSISYGAITNLPYAEYCLLENATSSAGCAWVAGSAPTSYTVSAGNGSKAISIWLRDVAGNVSNRVTTAAIDYDSSVPTVSITSPAVGAYANLSDFAAFTVSGTCSVNGATVSVSGAAAASATCTGGAWTASLDLASVADGAFTIKADLSNGAGTPATQASRSFDKDVAAPTVAIASPAAGSYIDAANVSAFNIAGTCSENGRNVALSGSISITTPCVSGTWSVDLDFTAVADGAITVNANHSDAAGNAATPDSRAFTKDASVPTLASVTITNSNPTNSTAYGLSYGAQSGAFSSVCILENSTTFAGCSSAWVARTTLPTSFTVSGTNDVKALTIWLKDDAGNVSTLVTSSNSVELDTVAPIVVVLAPNGGENFLAGTTSSLTYTAIDANLTATPISQSTSVDSGATWTPEPTNQNPREHRIDHGYGAGLRYEPSARENHRRRQGRKLRRRRLRRRLHDGLDRSALRRFPDVGERRRFADALELRPGRVPVDGFRRKDHGVLLEIRFLRRAGGRGLVLGRRLADEFLERERELPARLRGGRLHRLRLDEERRRADLGAHELRGPARTRRTRPRSPSPRSSRRPSPASPRRPPTAA